MRLLPTFALLLAVGASVSACGAKKPPVSPLQYSENARIEYEDALKAYFDKDWEEATLLFKEVKRKYGYSRYARLADLRLADIEFKQEKFAESISSYKAFVHDYPNDPEVPYARYRVAKALFEQSGPTLLLPPLEERDLASVHDAYDSIRAFLGDFPNYKQARELSYMLEMVAGLLARHELYVARFYLTRGNFDAAVARCQHALRTYEGSGLEPEAMLLLGETYMKMHKRKRARAVLRQMLSLHPDSAFGIPARNFLKLMQDDAAIPLAPLN
ncbi:MAG: tetratricopeptide repeat protein [Myxococcales bacterium]|nr:tetratricopeptide repeat protein [Myxococcales bacterium]